MVKVFFLVTADLCYVDWEILYMVKTEIQILGDQLMSHIPVQLADLSSPIWSSWLLLSRDSLRCWVAKKSGVAWGQACKYYHWRHFWCCERKSNWAQLNIEHGGNGFAKRPVLDLDQALSHRPCVSDICLQNASLPKDADGAWDSNTLDLLLHPRGWRQAHYPFQNVPQGAKTHFDKTRKYWMGTFSGPLKFWDASYLINCSFQDITGQIVLVTGGGSGIGRLMCLKLVW